MDPYYSFNPALKEYMFLPGAEIFSPFPTFVDKIVTSSFYEIFDGFHHVSL
jgi:hypothetical protein